MSFNENHINTNLPPNYLISKDGKKVLIEFNI